MAKLTPEQLAEIAERRKKVDFTGQWEYIPEGDIVYGGDIPVAEEIGHVWEGEFIAASYSDIPALLDHIKALEGELQDIKDTFSHPVVYDSLRHYDKQCLYEDGEWRPLTAAKELASSFPYTPSEEDEEE